jgi:16S rRNA processing protein RimM
LPSGRDPSPEGLASAWLPFGVLRRPHGTRGEILLAPFNSDGDRTWAKALPAAVRWVKGDRVLETEIVASRPVAGGFLVRLAAAPSREALADFVGGEVQVRRQSLPALASEEFYLEDLVGCDVFLSDGARLGRVAGTFWNGAHEVMAVVAEDGAERLVPVLPGFLLSFDAAARRATVDLHE